MCFFISIPLQKHSADAAFTFTGSAITATGESSGYEIDGTHLTIEASGTYLLSGEYPDNGSAENAVIKCKDGSQVTICGTGTLSITANCKNGIKSGATTDEEGEASLIIKELTLNISAPVNDAINAQQLLSIESGTLSIAAGDDAVHSDLVLNIGSEGTEGPTISIAGCCEGLEASELNVLSGDITILSSDDCMNAANSDLGNYDFVINSSGGTIVVWTANRADNQSLDADGTLSVTGVTVLAAGVSNGMGASISAKQPYVTFGSSGGTQPGARPGGNMGDMQPPSGEPGGQKPDGEPPAKPE